MSEAFSNTQYTFSIDAEARTGNINGSFIMYGGADGNDALALEILAALNGVSWPTGITNPVSVSKLASNDVAYTTNLTTIPPSFV